MEETNTTTAPATAEPTTATNEAEKEAEFEDKRPTRRRRAPTKYDTYVSEGEDDEEEADDSDDDPSYVRTSLHIESRSPSQRLGPNDSRAFSTRVTTLNHIGNQSQE